MWRDFDETDFDQVAADFAGEDAEISDRTEISPEMRTLRQRADVAAYLRKDAIGNYNPKTRETSEATEFVKAGASEVARLRETARTIGNFSDVANPTEAEILWRATERKKAETSEARKRKLEEAYGEISDHTEIFGSYFDKETQRWGFACCRSLDRDERSCNCKQ